MTEKFTEKEYQDIIDLSNRSATVSEAIDNALRYLRVRRGSIMPSISIPRNITWRAIALVNPVTRDLAHKLYVEEEEKYYWITKKVGDSGKPLTLMHGGGGVVQMMCPLERLTRTEVVEWGFNPDSYIYTTDKDEAIQLAEGVK